MRAPFSLYLFLFAAILTVSATVDHGLRSREIQELQSVEAGSTLQLSGDIAANREGQFLDELAGVVAAGFVIGAVYLLYKEKVRLTES